jgi:LPXTG-site transpeptidase (sortase) family protein
VPPFTKAELVLDINKGAAGSNISNITAVGKSLFFSANNGTSGNELWKSDPPYIAETTGIVSSISPGKDSSWPDYLAVVDGTLFFTARDDEHGSELRVLDRAAWSLPETGFAPNRMTRLPQKPAGLTYNNSEGMTFSIPGQLISIPLVGVSQTGSGWDLTWLSREAGYLEGSAFPTLPGNTVIAGHAYLADGTPGPFKNLDQMKWGDHLEINAWGQRFFYEVREIKNVAPDDKSVMRHEKEDWVTLVTCQGFNEKTGRYNQRVVVRAVRVAVH